MKVSFWLTRPDAVNETSVYARICYSGYKLKFYTKESISPKFWNKRTQRAHTKYLELNANLNRIAQSIMDIHRRFINDTDEVPSPPTLKKILDKEIHKMEAPKDDSKKSFFGFYEEIINHTTNGTRLNPKTGKPIAANTLKTYKTTYTHLCDFQKVYKKKIDFDTIDLDFHYAYTEYVTKKLKLSTNTIGKHFQIIKLIMNEANERGIHQNMSYKSKRFVIPREKADSIYLRDEEIKDIENLDLSDNLSLDKVRDLFLIACHTGLRFSDYSILKPENIINGYINKNQSKTKGDVVIPINDTVNKILAKYNGELPKSISNQKTNKYLKEIGKKIPALHEEITKTYTKGGFEIIEKKPKWQAITTHTGRRSFATNEYLKGTPTISLMALTGHRTEKSFHRYIKLTSMEHANVIKMNWQKRKELQVV